jgi:hypothetical protein
MQSMEFLFWTALGTVILLVNHALEGGFKEDGILGSIFVLAPRVVLGSFITHFLFSHQVYSYNTESAVLGGVLPVGVLFIAKPLKILNEKLEFSKNRRKFIEEEFAKSFDALITNNRLARI